jgi:hypothetical protein
VGCPAVRGGGPVDTQPQRRRPLQRHQVRSQGTAFLGCTCGAPCGSASCTARHSTSCTARRSPGCTQGRHACSQLHLPREVSSPELRAEDAQRAAVHCSSNREHPASPAVAIDSLLPYAAALGAQLRGEPCWRHTLVHQESKRWRAAAHPHVHLADDSGPDRALGRENPTELLLDPFWNQGRPGLAEHTTAVRRSRLPAR